MTTSTTGTTPTNAAPPPLGNQKTDSPGPGPPSFNPSQSVIAAIQLPGQGTVVAEPPPPENKEKEEE